MTLYRKTILAIGATLVALLLLVYAVSQATLMHSFEQVEATNTINNVQRAYWAVMADLEELKTTIIDWSRWDDTYQFASDGNQAFINDNLMDSTFHNIGINLALVLNQRGEVVYQKAFDLEAGTAISPPASLRTYLQPRDLLITHLTTFNIVSGIIHLPEGELFVVSAPILTSSQQGPINGTLIFGRYLSQRLFTQIGSSLKLSVAVQSFTSTDLSADFQAAKNALIAGEPNFVLPLNDERVAGYQTIRDIYGHPILLLQIEMGRGIYRQGQNSLSYFVVALIVVGVSLAIVVLFLLDRGILRRLQSLSHAVTEVRTTGNLGMRANIQGADELATLAQGLNSMLEALATSRREVETSNTRLQQTNAQLSQLNDELEQRVSERTLALSEANDQLRQEIAERQQAQGQLAQARDQALEALRLKNQILANVSHDARTPLTSIILHAELLQRGSYGEIDAKQKEKLGNVLLSARQLLTFFNNMLGEAQITNGKINLADEPFMPVQLIADIMATVQPIVERKKLICTTEIDTMLPPALRGDAERLKQIVTNLIDNAIKFTDQGQINVRLYKRDDAHWCIEVKDSGRGIPEEAQSRIFEAFWQVDGSVTRDANRGVGLGLSIVKQLVTMMDGQISVNSAPQRGTTFTIALPLVLPAPTTTATTINAVESIPA
ncbi:MAG: CHASE4 domain-containing protein [Anaerolineae bacterium]